MPSECRKNIKIVVLGDIGRSPRMQYHALSLAQMGHKVDIIGYGETQPMNELKEQPLIFYHYLFPCPRVPQKFVNYIFKSLFQTLNLLFLLFVTSKTSSDLVLVQNPPAIPALIICWIYSKIVQAKLVIDWHNYAHTIMALSVENGNPLVKITKKIEVNIGRKADYNFCVTKAMKNDLKENWNIKSITLYDRPPKIFKSIRLEEKHFFLRDFFESVGKQFLCEDKNTVISEIIEGCVQLKSNRPGLLISCTSWTEDEDFSILLSSLQDYEDHHKNGNLKQLPYLICIITGKGPLKEFYCEQIAKKNWEHVFVMTPWLKSADYPLILGSGDLGVSLHTSSSGLDLPMKVVDMFGCGLPVCAYNFKCLDELVKNGENGHIFNSSSELSELIMNWFENFPNNKKQIKIEENFKANIKSFQNLRWEENWMESVSHVFK